MKLDPVKERQQKVVERVDLDESPKSDPKNGAKMHGPILWPNFPEKKMVS